MPHNAGTRAPHGTCSRYTNGGCRCAPCTHAMTTYNTAARNDRILGRPRLLDITGTHRRVTALMAIGWPGHIIADRAHTSAPLIHRISSRFQPRISRRIAAAVDQVYRDLRYTPGPSRATTDRALAADWPVPEQWDDATIDDPNARPDTLPVSDIDPVIVARACHGRARYADLTPAERAVVIERLHAQRLTDGQIAVRLGTNVTTIQHRRSRAGLTTYYTRSA